jgi:hypothetical protein
LYPIRQLIFLKKLFWGLILGIGPKISPFFAHSWPILKKNPLAFLFKLHGLCCDYSK